MSEIGGESIDISEDVTVVRNEDGTWGKICSELGGDDDEMPEGEDMEAGASAEPIEATTEG